MTKGTVLLTHFGTKCVRRTVPFVTPLSHHCASDRADRQHVAASGSDGAINSLPETVKHVERHESLDSAGKAAAVDAECAAAVQKHIAEGESYADSLVVNGAFDGDVLEVHVG